MTSSLPPPTTTTTTTTTTRSERDDPSGEKKASSGYIRPARIPTREYPCESDLPDTIKLLREPTSNARIYLVGTAHFSEKSQREVAQVNPPITLVNGRIDGDECLLFSPLDHREDAARLGDGGIVSQSSEYSLLGRSHSAS